MMKTVFLPVQLDVDPNASDAELAELLPVFTATAQAAISLRIESEAGTTPLSEGAIDTIRALLPCCECLFDNTDQLIIYTGRFRK